MSAKCLFTRKPDRNARKCKAVKYDSDKYAGDANALIDVSNGGSFADMVAAKGDKEIGDKINKIIARLAVANSSLQGAINVADFNDEEKLGKGKDTVDRLTKLVAVFEGLNLGGTGPKVMTFWVMPSSIASWVLSFTITMRAKKGFPVALGRSAPAKIET